MLKQAIEGELEKLSEVIGRYPEGVSIAELLRAPGIELHLKTLQRRLAVLQERGKVVAEGKSRATKYYLLPVYPLEADPTPAFITDTGIPLSTRGQEIRAYVSLSPIQRKPVGYNRGFLDAYQPNQTFYLSASVRAELTALGKPFASEILPAGTYAKQILDRLLIDLSWNSSRLEGNTYSRLETQRLIALGQRAEGKDSLETQMILNHKEAIQFLVEAAEQIGFNRSTILNLHAILSDNLLPDPQACGRLRSHSVHIGGSVYLPLVIPHLIEECFMQILNVATAIEDPFEQAFFVMVHLPYLQPFEDVNKRVSRLSANIPLIRHNLCPLSFVGVPDRTYIEGILGVYERNQVDLLRDVFVWAYKRSCENYLAIRQSLGEPDPFRLRYRQQIIDVIAQVIRQKLPKQALSPFLTTWSKENLQQEDTPRFIGIIETELLALHSGNYGRFRLRESEFQSWFNLFH